MSRNVHNEIDSVSNEIILELLVNNHPGVRSHICNLFSRRAYNLEAIVVFPVEDGLVSRVWLKMNEESKLDQIIKQLEKMVDVKKISHHTKDHSIFSTIQSFEDGSRL